MRKYMKHLAVIMVLLFVFSIGAGFAQTLDDQLTWNDYYVSQQFAMYPPDARYNEVMAEIASSLNDSIVDTFGEDKDINFHVCLTPLGFNAVAFHRFIVFDSLLLDTLRYMAMGKVYYGGMNNEYIDRLACRVAEVSQYHKMGQSQANYHNQENPFNLPHPGDLTSKQLDEAAVLFANILASWMAHEGSHCMRDHLKHRLQAMQKSNQQFNYQGSQQQFKNSVDAYTNAKISQELEKDADVHAVAWLLNSGYNIEGYLTWLEFGSKLEEIMGTKNAYLRTHPPCQTRMQYIRQAAREFSGY
ncbi:MAG: M48 family metalloprotease [Vulcanimicrobiota bacterium]